MTDGNTDGNVAGGPLAGIRVLELGSFIAGPFAGQLLGDYGAEVIKVEAPGRGDPMRRWGVVRDGESLWWPGIARNKKSVAIDLRTEAGRDLVRRITAEVDVVIENFRPGTLEDWGLTYGELAEANPGLVMTHVSGYGQTGPMAAEAGFGSIGEAMGGIRNLTGSPDRPPSRSGISLGDALAALFAVIGTLAALNERSRSGRGQQVDVAIYEAVAALLESTMADHEAAGVTRGRTGSILPGVAPSNVYPTADGAEVVIAANADSVFARLCTAMDVSELADDPRYADHEARGEHMDELDERIGAWTRRFPVDELLELLGDHKVPAGRIFTAPDMLADPQYAARDMIARLTNHAGRSLPYAGVVPKFSRTPGTTDDPGPTLGAHTRRVLGELIGTDDAEWETLAAAGVVAGGT